jgi:hypothetical protein
VCAAGAGPGLQNQCPKLSILSPNSDAVSTSVEQQIGQQSDLAGCLARLAQTSPELAFIVKRWNMLSPAFQAAIVTMVKSATFD